MDKQVSVVDLYSQSAMTKISELGLSPSPENYTVFHNYFADSYPDLTRAIDKILEQSKHITEIQCEELFERFFVFAQERAVLNQAIKKIEGIVANATECVGEAGKAAAGFGSALSDAAGSLSAPNSGTTAPMTDVIEAILSATRGMEAHARKVEQKLAASTAEILELRQEVETTRQEAATDSLTGVANRKCFDLALRQEMTDAEASGSSLCLLMLDIDHFKSFNDVHGHQTGDQVLGLVVHTLMESVKGSDTAARYGGDEFAVILPNIDLSDAINLADKVCDRLSSKRVINRSTNKQLGTITLSVGVAKYDPNESPGQFISRADAALYRAKRDGRNCVASEIEMAIN